MIEWHEVMQNIDLFMCEFYILYHDYVMNGNKHLESKHESLVNIMFESMVKYGVFTCSNELLHFKDSCVLPQYGDVYLFSKTIDKYDGRDLINRYIHEVMPKLNMELIEFNESEVSIICRHYMPLLLRDRPWLPSGGNYDIHLKVVRDFFIRDDEKRFFKDCTLLFFPEYDLTNIGPIYNKMPVKYESFGWTGYYGGRPWSNLSKVLYWGASGYLTKSAFLDMCFGLQHNTMNWMTKLGINCGISDIEYILNMKREGNIDALRNHLEIENNRWIKLKYLSSD
jgi:hypothetical protein